MQRFDVVATIDHLVTAMPRAAKVTNANRMIDLGSGGRQDSHRGSQTIRSAEWLSNTSRTSCNFADCYASTQHVTLTRSLSASDIFATDFSEERCSLYLSPQHPPKTSADDLEDEAGHTRPGQHSRHGRLSAADRIRDRQHACVFLSCPRTRLDEWKKNGVNGWRADADRSERKDAPAARRIVNDTIAGRGYLGTCNEVLRGKVNGGE